MVKKWNGINVLAVINVTIQNVQHCEFTGVTNNLPIFRALVSDSSLYSEPSLGVRSDYEGCYN
jgi:hypothetical protein